jgi:hypothetical protein
VRTQLSSTVDAPDRRSGDGTTDGRLIVEGLSVFPKAGRGEVLVAPAARGRGDRVQVYPSAVWMGVGDGGRWQVMQGPTQSPTRLRDGRSSRPANGTTPGENSIGHGSAEGQPLGRPSGWLADCVVHERSEQVEWKPDQANRQPTSGDEHTEPTERSPPDGDTA